MCLSGCCLELQSIKVAFLYAFNGNSCINSVISLIGGFARSIFLLFISVLTCYSLRLF